MVREDTVCMSQKELRRVHMLRLAMEKKVQQREVAGWLGVTVRHVRRLIKRLRAEGEAGLVHRLRGQPSNRRYPLALKVRVLALCAKHYEDFGPTLAAEKLAERHHLELSAETLRLWLRAEGRDHFGRRPRPHRVWRERKAYCGELVQLDGSHHDWLEGRGPRCVLMASIDEATSRIWARFYEYEGTMPALESFARYVRRYGVPRAVYADRHTTYKSPAEPTLEEQLAGREPQSQFERCLAELGTELIHAQSPQAKGRIERLFKTLQDRLIKELRLAGIATLEAANAFLEQYLPQYNRRFAVQAAQAADLHRPLPTRLKLERVLCVKTRRALRRDWTVAHDGQLYQVETAVQATHVLVEDRLDGTRSRTHQGRPLRYHAIAARPVKATAPQQPRVVVRRVVKPKPDHPWSRLKQFAARTHAAAGTT
jgi:DNA-binding MarR family transcriptional regulator